MKDTEEVTRECARIENELAARYDSRVKRFEAIKSVDKALHESKSRPWISHPFLNLRLKLNKFRTHA